MTRVRTGQNCSTPDTDGSNVNLNTVLNNGNDGGGEQIKNIADPTADQDAATKKYVDDEISESQHYRGVYATLVALQAAIPTGNPGDYADVDAGVGTEVARYIWDDDDDEWIEGGGASSFADLTGSPSDNAALAAALALKADLTAVIGLQDLFIPATAMWPRTTGGCAALAKTEMTTSLFNVQSLDFDQTTQEFAQFQIVLPRNWNNGTITAKVYWTAASGSGTVQWGISGGAYSNDDALTVALGSAQTVDDTLIAANDLHSTDYTSAITLAGTPADADFLAIQISRNPASDTLTADAKLLGVVITLTTDAAIAS